MAVLPSPCDRKSLGKAEPLAALGEGRSLQPLGGGSKDIWVSKGFVVGSFKDNELSPARFVGFSSGRLGQESLIASIPCGAESCVMVGAGCHGPSGDERSPFNFPLPQE